MISKSQPIPQIITHADFFGCCGVDIWYLGGIIGGQDSSPYRYTRNYSKESLLKNLIDKREERKIAKGVAIVILAAHQIDYAQDLIEFGFTRNWGNIKNPNTQRDLFQFSYNLTKYREESAKKPPEPMFKGK